MSAGPSTADVLPAAIAINQLTYDLADAMQIGPLKGIVALLGHALNAAQVGC